MYQHTSYIKKLKTAIEKYFPLILSQEVQFAAFLR